MSMLEQELKLLADNAEVLEAILNSALIRRAGICTGTHGPERFHAIYYDTSNLILEQKKYSLRAREEGERMVAAFKLPGSIVDGLSQRVEYEVELQGWLKTPDDLPESELKQQVLTILDPDAELVHRVEVDMQRTIRMLEAAGSHIELVADRGIIKGSHGEYTLYELELELKQGEVGPVLSLGQQIAEEFGLTPSRMTKHEIGLTLCN
ncbi:MAG: CYTH domain-containing protein [Arenicellales bacterium]